jgi:Rieske Fe-S protein
MSDLLSAYAKSVPAEGQWERKAKPVQTPPLRPSVETRRLEAEYPAYLDSGALSVPVVEMRGQEAEYSAYSDRTVPFTPPIEMRRQEAEYPRYPDRARPGRPSTPFSIPKLRTDIQRNGQKGKVRRRQVTAVLAGSVVLGLAGLGSVNLVHMLTAGPQTQTQAAPVAKVAKGIGQTTMPVNSAIQFMDKSVPEFRQRLLIHLPNGQFVAYKQGCTHTGVLVDYHPDTHLLVCPAHGAIFDPSKNGSVVTGPTSIPLPKVAIHIMGDGSIALA